MKSRVRNSFHMASAFDDVASTIHQSLMDSARQVIGCHLSLETRVRNAFDDVASAFDDVSRKMPITSRNEW